MNTLNLRKSAFAFICLLLLFSASAAQASDHADNPLLASNGLHGARITDLYAFIRNGNLVVTVSLDPSLAMYQTTYTFLAGLSVSINIDTQSQVDLLDPHDLLHYGGTIVNPGAIAATHNFTVRFNADGTQTVTKTGFPANAVINLFTGLRDDPFIRSNRAGFNTAAVAIETPLSNIIPAGAGVDGNEFLVWASTSLPATIQGNVVEHAGRALRSQFIEVLPMNVYPPNLMSGVFSQQPDVIIIDPDAPIRFPNGRELTDDVVDIVALELGDYRVYNQEAPNSPTANDVPFLSAFPYLAAPQAQQTPSITSDIAYYYLDFSVWYEIHVCWSSNTNVDVYFNGIKDLANEPANSCNTFIPTDDYNPDYALQVCQAGSTTNCSPTKTSPDSLYYF